MSISASLASVALPLECTHLSLLPNPHCPILNSSSQTCLCQSPVTFTTTTSLLLSLSLIFLNKILKKKINQSQSYRPFKKMLVLFNTALKKLFSYSIVLVSFKKPTYLSQGNIAL